jgi:hypothetical protein
MPNKTFAVDHYKLNAGFKNTAIWGGIGILIQGYVACYSSKGERLIVYGLHPSSLVPPAPVCNWAGNVGAVFVPFREMHAYVDIVRNEKPVYARLDTDHPEWMGLTTSNEPLGEGE